MSERNTGLFLSGHVPGDEIAAAIWSWPGIRPGDLRGSEQPRLGHGSRQGHDFTLVALRLFEVAGFMIIDQAQVPSSDDLECHLGRLLSTGRQAVFLHYDEERGGGGHARFEDGELTSRLVYDGRAFQPVRRDLAGEQPLAADDDEDWIWGDIAAAVEAGAGPVLGEGVRTDDDLAAVIAGVQQVRLEAPADLGTTTARRQPAPGPRPRRRRLRSLIRRLSSREPS